MEIPLKRNVMLRPMTFDLVVDLCDQCSLVKLLTRSQKIAYNLLHKVHSHGSTGSNSRENLLKPGDRVCSPFGVESEGDCLVVLLGRACLFQQ